MPSQISPGKTTPTKTTECDLSIIIVSWNVWDLLRASLTSIEQVSRAFGSAADLRVFGPSSLGSQALTLEVIVVDNASSDATASLLPARFPWVRFIRNSTNWGFTAANNLGYATSRGRAIYFLNPDTELVTNPNFLIPTVPSSGPASVPPTTQTAAGFTTASTGEDDSLWRLYRALIDNAKVGLVGPQLRYGDNTLQSSRRRFPTALTPFFEASLIGRYWRNNPWQQRKEMSDWPASFQQEVDWVVGAAMMARRSALEDVRPMGANGPFDEGFFMYCEETDLCYRLKQRGRRILYVPEAIVIHYEGRSSSQVVAERDIHDSCSKIHYAKKYFGKGWATFLRFALLLNFRIQWLIETCKWLLGHKRPLRASRMRAYRKVINSKLQRE